MFRVLRRRFRLLCSRIRWMLRRRPKPKFVIRKFGKLNSSKGKPDHKHWNISPNPNYNTLAERPIIRIATFNVALFTLAPAIPRPENDPIMKSPTNYPKGILKNSPLHHPNKIMMKSKPKVSINLPENEISLAQMMRSPICFPNGMENWMNNDDEDGSLIGIRTIFDVLKEVDADILALQDVKAEEEKNMSPLSDLAEALGMNYVFAEGWAPEYGNAILSKWPIKKWRVQKIYDDKDFRNVLKATIDVAGIGDLYVYCTQLDHLDENWRMKQMSAIIQSSDNHPHILAGGLNSLDSSDYSTERWMNIVKYYEEIGKPTPKVEVMKFLKERQYRDAKDFQGEFEPVVMIAKGQSVQGTCKYGTRVDYIMASPELLNYRFVPGSYSVISSKGTSDHHIVKVDLVKAPKVATRRSKICRKLKEKVVKVTSSCVSRGVMLLTT